MGFVLLSPVFALVSDNPVCSHPSVGKVGEAFLHQDGFQHVRLHHDEYGPPQLIRAVHLHKHNIYISLSTLVTMQANMIGSRVKTSQTKFHKGGLLSAFILTVYLYFLKKLCRLTPILCRTF